MKVNYLKNFKMEQLKKYYPGGALKPISDEYVGELIVKGTKISLLVSPRDQISYVAGQIEFQSGNTYNEHNILVILESPHRFEYDASLNPIALMMGKTGELFFEYFTAHLEKSILKIREGNYNLIVCNAVQYQTSCGLNPINRKIRDENWKDIYLNYGGEEDFKKRVFSIKPRYTINLCTGGRSPSGLRSYINNSLDSFGLKKSKHYTEGNHPASWYLARDSRSQLIV
jgi:hypothetical protein